nr:flagellar biosynthetic protein FliO [Oceanococcus sp. HetDA_MAG_MS8]
MSTVTPMLSMLLVLFGLLAAFWVLTRGLARMPALQKLLPKASGRILTSVAVGPRERVVVVDLGGEALALGVAPGRVQLLTKLDAQTAKALTSSAHAPASSPRRNASS